MTQALLNTVREETLEGAGGLKIFVRSWRPTAKARGVVAIVPGFNSHGGCATQSVRRGLWT
jgi:acylglycerol lipase